MCVVVAGRPGSGKSTLARELSGLLHVPMLSRDEIKEGYVVTRGVSHDELPAETNRVVTDLFFETARALLASGVSLVVEAAFQHKLWQEAVHLWSEVGDVQFVICDADAALCAQRHLERGLADARREYFHGDKRVRIYRETGELPEPGPFTPPAFDVPTIVVNTTNGYEPGLSELASYVMGDVCMDEGVGG